MLYVLMIHDKGLDINTLDNEGNTILLLATKMGIRNNLRLVNKLLEIGSNPEIKNNKQEGFYYEIKKQSVEDHDFLNLLFQEKEYSGDDFKEKESEIKNIKMSYSVTIIFSVLCLLFARLLAFFDK